MLLSMGDRVTELEHELERMQAKIDALTDELAEARHYRNAVEGSPIGIMSVSAAKGRYAFVNEAFARRYVAGRNPIGRHISAWGRQFTIVGTVATTVYLSGES